MGRTLRRKEIKVRDSCHWEMALVRAGCCRVTGRFWRTARGSEFGVVAFKGRDEDLWRLICQNASGTPLAFLVVWGFRDRNRHAALSGRETIS